MTTKPSARNYTMDGRLKNCMVMAHTSFFVTPSGNKLI
jgi:hypothetical protein